MPLTLLQPANSISLLIKLGYAIVYSGGAYKFYKNGVLQSSSYSVDGFKIDYYSSSSSGDSFSYNLPGSNFKFKGIDVTSNSIKFYEPDEPVFYVRNT